MAYSVHGLSAVHVLKGDIERLVTGHIMGEQVLVHLVGHVVWDLMRSPYLACTARISRVGAVHTSRCIWLQPPRSLLCFLCSACASSLARASRASVDGV